MSVGRLRRSVALRGTVCGGVVSLLLAACQPPAPVIRYSGPRLRVRTAPASIRVFPNGVPDRGYLETGTVEINCAVENSSGALGSLSQQTGCPYEQAMNLARQNASDVGADGIFGITTNPTANGNIALLRATAFRYSSLGEEFPELSATVQRITPGGEPPAPVQAPPPPVVPQVAPQPTEPPMAQEALPVVQPEPVYAPPPPPPAAVQAPAMPRPPIVSRPPVVTKQPQPQALPAPPAPPVAASRPPAPVKAPVVPPPPQAIEVPVQTAAGAATLLPASERLKRLQELRDKKMIPAEMFERRKKELLLEMQKPGG